MRMIRLMSEKTLDDIFMETGIPPSKLSRIERGIVPPTFWETEKLGKALNVDPGELFLEDPDV
jgi:transcriptional regulator with XRE-family HTH domain